MELFCTRSLRRVLGYLQGTTSALTYRDNKQQVEVYANRTQKHKQYIKSLEQLTDNSSSFTKKPRTKQMHKAFAYAVGTIVRKKSNLALSLGLGLGLR